MSETDDYIIKELSRGFEPHQIIKAMIEAGYKEDKIRPMVEKHARVLGKKTDVPKERLLPNSVIIFGILPTVLVLLILGILYYDVNKALSTVLISSITFIVGVSITSKSAEHVLKELGFHNVMNTMYLMILSGGLILFLVTLIFPLHPLIIGLFVVPFFFFVLVKHMNMSHKEAASFTVYVGGISIVTCYVILTMLGVIFGIAKAVI
ncbi:MAG: hypothetical protein KJ709_04645 [Nanoarchaeota archaeon]|nr:hypothetical protein [Nanoarchaeota archaeon]